MIRKALAGYRLLSAIVDHEDARQELRELGLAHGDAPCQACEIILNFRIRERVAREEYLGARPER